jgi:hypothetical protein
MGDRPARNICGTQRWRYSVCWRCNIWWRLALPPCASVALASSASLHRRKFHVLSPPESNDRHLIAARKNTAITHFICTDTVL